MRGRATRRRRMKLVGAEPIRVDEWLAELARLGARNDEGLTTNEIAEALGCHDRQARRYIRKAMAQGWVRRGQRTVEGIDGRQMPVPVYRIEVRRGK